MSMGIHVVGAVTAFVAVVELASLAVVAGTAVSLAN